MMDDDRRIPGGVADAETLRTFLDRGPILAFIRDDSGRYLYDNRWMEQQFGVLAADLDGQEDGAWIGAVPQPDGSAQYWKIVRFPFDGPGGTRVICGVA